MLMGHTLSFHGRNDSNQYLLEDPTSEVGDEEEAEVSGKVLFRATFDELATNYVQYDTVIWVLISLPLVLAWGIGVLMLLYLPVRRYVLQKDISSRKLYITPQEIIYKVTRPSFLPFIGFSKIEKRIPLHLIISVIVEQGCLQAVYGIHTIRIESIATGKAAPADELQIQGVSSPDLLRKVVIFEAAKKIQEFRNRTYIAGGEVPPNPASYVGNISPLPVNRFQSPRVKFFTPPQRALEDGSAMSNHLLLHKLEDMRKSVKKIESLVGGSAPPSGRDY